MTLVDARFDPATNEADVSVRFLGELTSVVRDPQGAHRRGRPQGDQAAARRLDLLARHGLRQPELAPDRHRRLTPACRGAGCRREERELWRKVAATASPLRVEPPSLDAPAPPPPPVAGPSRPAPAPRPAPAQGPGRVTLDLAPDPHAALERAHPHMDRRRFDKLRRGRLEPEARLDLHGMTSERAHAALTAFVLAAHASGLRLVLVITGKGRPGDGTRIAPQRHGVLRHSLPHWLAAPPLASKVLQVATAHQRHGGGGAFYVYLRPRSADAISDHTARA